MTRLSFPEQTLADLLPAHGLSTALGQRPVQAVTDDSREVDERTVFIARPGAADHGECYVADAISRGAPAVISEKPGPEAARIVVPRLPDAAVALVSRARGVDLRALKIIGITGTNGKTSVAHFIAGALNRSAVAHERPVGLIGTLGAGLWSEQLDELIPAANTTPGLLGSLDVLTEFCRANVRYVVMEVSSHALAQGRLDGIPIHVAVFTNLSRDHLDYHGDMASYFASKARLFERDELELAVVNFDSDWAGELIERIAANPRNNAQCWAFGLGEPGWAVDACQIIRPHRVAATDNGLQLSLETPLGGLALTVRLTGLFNAGNLMAALSVLLGLGMSVEDARAALADVQSPPGRMQTFHVADGPHVVIDYAHTPDALEQVLRALRDHVPAGGRLLCVFGCGGDRDRGKRPEMGQVAERLADSVILTDDNPRSEEPARIVDEILAGIARRDRVEIVHDRARAIGQALRQARSVDWVLVAGKGHEPYQEIGGKRLPFSDAAVVNDTLKEGAA